MTAFLLAAWLCTQAWSWDAVPNATGYRVYWANNAAGPWLACNYVEVPVSACDATSCEWATEAGGTAMYWVAVAYNAAGESEWPVSVPRIACEVEP